MPGTSWAASTPLCSNTVALQMHCMRSCMPPLHCSPLLLAELPGTTHSHPQCSPLHDTRPGDSCCRMSSHRRPCQLHHRCRLSLPSAPHSLASCTHPPDSRHRSPAVDPMKTPPMLLAAAPPLHCTWPAHCSRPSHTCPSQRRRTCSQSAPRTGRASWAERIWLLSGREPKPILRRSRRSCQEYQPIPLLCICLRSGKICFHRH